MALVSIAIALWNHAIASVPEIQPDKKESRKALLDLIPEWTDHLQLPNSLATCIRNHLNDLLLNIYCWIHFHRNVLESDPRRHMHCIVWYPNGAIDNYKTALNLMKSDKLSDEEKYRLACTFCMKKEIKNLRKTLIATPVLQIDMNIFHLEPLVTYWNCYYADKLHMIPVEDNLSLGTFMIRKIYHINWPAVEYFFDRLSVKEQVACTIDIIKEGCIEYQALMLMKTNESQRMQILANKAVKMIRNYAPFKGPDISDPIIISIWYEARDLISLEAYAKLFKALCNTRPAPSDDVLAEIWASSYREFKLHVLKLHNCDFIRLALRWGHHKLRPGLDFLFAVLADATREGINPQPDQIPERKRYFNFLHDKLIIKRDFKSVARLRNFKQILTKSV